jgi:hypothetical protein
VVVEGEVVVALVVDPAVVEGSVVVVPPLALLLAAVVVVGTSQNKKIIIDVQKDDNEKKFRLCVVARKSRVNNMLNISHLIIIWKILAYFLAISFKHELLLNIHSNTPWSLMYNGIMSCVSYFSLIHHPNYEHFTI